MEKSKVFFTDFRTPAYGDGLTTKLQKLLKKAGIEQLDMDGKFVAIKMHFGELGNLSFLRPNYARAVADLVKSLGGRPFLTDCNTMYPDISAMILKVLYRSFWQLLTMIQNAQSAALFLLTRLTRLPRRRTLGLGMSAVNLYSRDS